RRDPQNDAAATTAAPQPFLSQGGGFSVFVVVLGVFLRRVFGFFRVRALVVRGLPGGVRFLAVRSLLGLHTLWVLSGHIITLSVGHGVDGFVGDLVGVAVFSAGRVRFRGGPVVCGVIRRFGRCLFGRGVRTWVGGGGVVGRGGVVGGGSVVSEHRAIAVALEDGAWRCADDRPGRGRRSCAGWGGVNEEGRCGVV